MAPEMLCRSPSGSELEPGPPILGRAGGNCSRRRGQPAPRAQPSNPTAFHACLTQEQTLNCKTGSGPWLFFFFFPPFFTILLKRIHKEKGKKKNRTGPIVSQLGEAGRDRGSLSAAGSRGKTPRPRGAALPLPRSSASCPQASPRDQDAFCRQPPGELPPPPPGRAGDTIALFFLFNPCVAAQTAVEQLQISH